MIRRLLRAIVGPPGTPSLHWRLWCVFAFVAILLVGFCNWLEYRDRASQAAVEKRAAYLQDQENRIMRPVWDLCPKNRTGMPHPMMLYPRWVQARSIISAALAPGSKPTLRKVEELLNEGKPYALKTGRRIVREVSPFTGAESQRRVVAQYATHTDRASGMTLRLVFVDGRYHATELLVPSWPKHQSSPLLHWVCGGHELYQRLRGYLFASLVLVSFCTRRYGALLAELALMAAVCGLIAQVPSLQYWGQFPIGNMLNDAAFAWQAAFVAMGTAALLLAQASCGRRSRIGCGLCDYNLAGNTSGICPECGTPIPADIRERLAQLEPVVPMEGQLPIA
jgi:hypothetical protein